MYFSTDYESPLGEMTIASDGEAICMLCFNDKNHFQSDNLMQKDDLAIFKRVRKWLDDYFRGSNPKINFKLNPKGSEFRQRVWKIVSDIPYGETMTYGEIAKEISQTMSPQAVGGAVGHNPIAVIIPCHRVMGANGKLTGYAGGIDRKVELLKIENILNSI